ncbi:MAG: hypothetical protein WBD16_16085 [Pyrinomonadaceae bacterium]
MKYFTSLERLAATHAVTIEFVTLEWINENFTSEKVLRATDSKLEFVAKNAPKRKLERDYYHENISSTGHFNRISSEIDIESFFVNELSDGSLQITVDYRGEVEFECEVEETDDAGNTDYDYKYVYPEVILGADILVKDKKIVEWSAAEIC